MAGADAFATEQAIHAAFRSKRIRPGVPLRSGNTECYPLTEDIAWTFVNIINAV